ncbi:hypothetical protein IWZ01DRAFT_523761 [Phyllosticta capitalensis]
MSPVVKATQSVAARATLSAEFVSTWRIDRFRTPSEVGNASSRSLAERLRQVEVRDNSIRLRPARMERTHRKAAANHSSSRKIPCRERRLKRTVSSDDDDDDDDDACGSNKVCHITDAGHPPKAFESGFQLRDLAIDHMSLSWLKLARFCGLDHEAAAKQVNRKTLLSACACVARASCMRNTMICGNLFCGGTTQNQTQRGAHFPRAVLVKCSWHTIIWPSTCQNFQTNNQSVV